MKKNIGSIDKIIRLLLAAVFIILFIFNVVSGIFGYILLILALIFIITSLLNFCPIWWIMKIKTNRTK
ncbi:MAG: DUF2892 domain-containing protein [Bacteroidales bacterium]|jgi:hypothetical protein|nr:DUF2892 domain-containing protein [Bacteroidales bacterium]